MNSSAPKKTLGDPTLASQRMDSATAKKVGLVVGSTLTAYALFFANVAKYKLVHISFYEALVREMAENEQSAGAALVFCAALVLIGAAIGSSVMGWMFRHHEPKAVGLSEKSEPKRQALRTEQTDGTNTQDIPANLLVEDFLEQVDRANAQDIPTKFLVSDFLAWIGACAYIAALPFILIWGMYITGYLIAGAPLPSLPGLPPLYIVVPAALLLIPATTNFLMVGSFRLIPWKLDYRIRCEKADRRKAE